MKHSNDRSLKLVLTSQSIFATKIVLSTPESYLLPRSTQPSRQYTIYRALHNSKHRQVPSRYCMTCTPILKTFRETTQVFEGRCSHQNSQQDYSNVYGLSLQRTDTSRQRWTRRNVVHCCGVHCRDHSFDTYSTGLWNLIKYSNRICNSLIIVNESLLDWIVKLSQHWNSLAMRLPTTFFSILSQFLYKSSPWEVWPLP